MNRAQRQIESRDRLDVHRGQYAAGKPSADDTRKHGHLEDRVTELLPMDESPCGPHDQAQTDEWEDEADERQLVAVVEDFPG